MRSRSGSLARFAFTLALALSFVQFATAAEAPTPLFSRAFFTTPVDTFRTYLDVIATVADPAGGVVIAGDLHGSVDFGGGVVASRPWIASFGEQIDAYAAHFDSLGEHAWSRIVASANFMRPLSMAVDAAGNMVMVGDFHDTLDLYGVTLTTTFVDAFVAKYDADGAILWGKRFGLSGPLGNAAEDVGFDADGNIVVIGTLSGRMDFGGGVIQSFGSNDVFLVKLDANGEHMWTRRFGSANSQRGERLAIDGRGHLNVAGHFYDSIDLGGGPLATNGEQDVFIADLDAQGTHVWSRVIHGRTSSFAFSLDAGELGGVALGVPVFGSIDLGDGVLFGQGTIAARYDPTGVYRWKFFAERQRIDQVSFDDDESLIMCGAFSGLFDLGAGTMASVGDTDGYIARFNADGALEWATQVGGNGVDGIAYAIDAGRDLWIVGGFDDGIDLGSAHYDGSATFLARYGSASQPPVLDVSLIPTPSAIEVRWNVTTELPLDSLTILRGAPPASLQPVFTTSFGTGSGSFVDHGIVGGRRYQYQLVVTTPQGAEYQSSIVTTTATAPVFSNTLAQNAPNPFNPSTSIAYSVSQGGDVTLEIYDVSGAVVRRIEQGVRDAGEYSVEWDGRDEAGNVVGTGVYFYRLVGVSGVAPRKMVLVK